MRKRLVGWLLVVCVLLQPVVFASRLFSDLDKTHWAFPYIEALQEVRVIDGFPDGTFQAENQVKTGEFIKMVSMIVWPKFRYVAPTDGSHWAMPYVNSLNRVALKKEDYDATRLERYITRGEAAVILSKAFLQLRAFQGRSYQIDESEVYLQSYRDLASITSAEVRNALQICTQYGLINGFEDHTFRASERLTRAQAAKLMYVLLHN